MAKFWRQNNTVMLLFLFLSLSFFFTGFWPKQFQSSGGLVVLSFLVAILNFYVTLTVISRFASILTYSLSRRRPGPRLVVLQIAKKRSIELFRPDDSDDSHLLSYQSFLFDP